MLISPRKKQTQTSLPQEIITDILSRLQAKPLTRFKSVSKQFSGLINSPHLVTAHLRRSSPCPSLLIQRRRRHHASDSGISMLRDEATLALGADLRLPFMTAPYREPRIVGCCDGLLCLDIYSDNVWQPHSYVFWNPATARFLILPPPQIEDALWAAPAGDCTVGLGFGVCSSGTPKLVRVVCFESLEGAEEEVAVTRAEVFAARPGNGYWREIKVGIESFSIGETKQSVRVNGALHWSACGAGGGALREFIVSLDMVSEMFVKMPLPGFDRWSHQIGREIVEFNGKLGLFVSPRFGGVINRFELWVMNEMWTKVCTIGPFPRISKLMGIWRDTDIILQSMERYNGGLFMCRPESDSKDVKELPGYGADYSYQVNTYVESLLSWD